MGLVMFRSKGLYKDQVTSAVSRKPNSGKQMGQEGLQLLTLGHVLSFTTHLPLQLLLLLFASHVHFFLCCTNL